MSTCPITKKEAIVEYKYSSEKLIQLYKKELNVDISHLLSKVSSVDFNRCPETGFGFFSPISVAGDGKFYEELVIKKHSYYTPWKWEHENALKYLKTIYSHDQNFKLLEIGSAEGLFIKRVKEEFPNAEVHGLEINEDAIREAQNNGLKMTKGFIQDHQIEWESKYDFVLAFQVLEHIPEIRSFIESCIHVINSQGKLLFGVPNNDSYIFKNDRYHTLNLPPHHMGWWNDKSLRSLERYFQMDLIDTMAEPADLDNLGVFYDLWLKNNLPRSRKILYPLLRFPIKLWLKISPPKLGLTITAIFSKRLQ